MKISNKAYDFWKFVPWVWAPIVTLLTALINIWYFDGKYFEQIISTLVAIDGFVGAIIAHSNIKYNKENNQEEENV